MKARGWCGMHYVRWQRGRTAPVRTVVEPEPDPEPRTVEEPDVITDLLGRTAHQAEAIESLEERVTSMQLVMAELARRLRKAEDLRPAAPWSNAPQKLAAPR